MLRFVLAFLLILGQACTLHADSIEIAKSDQVENYSDVGYCAWCCLETLGWHHQVKSLYGFVKNRRAEPKWVQVDYGGRKKIWHKNNGGVDWAIYNKLKELKVKFYYQGVGDKSHESD